MFQKNTFLEFIKNSDIAVEISLLTEQLENAQLEIKSLKEKYGLNNLDENNQPMVIENKFKFYSINCEHYFNFEYYDLEKDFLEKCLIDDNELEKLFNKKRSNISWSNIKFGEVKENFYAFQINYFGTIIAITVKKDDESVVDSYSYVIDNIKHFESYELAKQKLNEKAREEIKRYFKDLEKKK